MCRSIRTLRGADPPPSTGDTHAAALQFVRKVSGYRAPSKRTEAAFAAAVDEVAAATERLLTALGEAVASGPEHRPPPSAAGARREPRERRGSRPSAAAAATP